MRKKGAKVPQRYLSKKEIEEQILFASMGNRQALETIIHCYSIDMERLATVMMESLSIYSSLIKKEDLIQEAMIGLWNIICIHKNPIEKSKILTYIQKSMKQYIKKTLSYDTEISNFNGEISYNPEEEIINGIFFDGMVEQLGEIEAKVYDLCFKQKFDIEDVRKNLGLSKIYMKEIIKQIKIKFEQYQILNGLILIEEELPYYDGLSKKNKILYLLRKISIYPHLVRDICQEYQISYFQFLENLLNFFPDLYKEFINWEAISYMNEFVKKIEGKALPHQNCYELFSKKEEEIDYEKKTINTKLRKLLNNSSMSEIEAAIEKLSSKEKQLVLALYPYNSSSSMDQKVISNQFGNRSIFIINGIVKKMRNMLNAEKYQEPIVKIKR